MSVWTNLDGSVKMHISPFEDWGSPDSSWEPFDPKAQLRRSDKGGAPGRMGVDVRSFPVFSEILECIVSETLPSGERGAIGHVLAESPEATSSFSSEDPEACGLNSCAEEAFGEGPKDYRVVDQFTLGFNSSVRDCSANDMLEAMKALFGKLAAIGAYPASGYLEWGDHSAMYAIRCGCDSISFCAIHPLTNEILESAVYEAREDGLGQDGHARWSYHLIKASTGWDQGE